MQATRITSPNGIESLEQVTLGGVKQWILIRGWAKSNPVLLHLHGGPGAPDMALARHFDGELVKHFTVVHWDQRGAGKSYSRGIPIESMNVEQFVSDTLDLTELLTKRFNAPKILVLGHSWGTEIGSLAVARRPDLFYAFVGIGQVVNGDEGERISYDYVVGKARASGNEKALRELEEIGPPPYSTHDKLLTQRKWLDRFGGVSHTGVGMGQLTRIGLTSPDYSLLDGINFFRGQAFSSNVWENMSKSGYHTNLFQEVPRIEVPVYFLVGRYDYNTPFELTERYYQQLEAPRGKQLIWFENSGHFIPYEEPEKYRDVLISKVLKETHQSAQGDVDGTKP
ncbi:MAG: alpha/beta hydrolase [Candidatus Lindowbacteria bacterium]|nr:alpha/beta hydrolase [Candidatus Lindowbacteria bacterium]